MKVVLNKCYGGFGLSEAAMIAYGKLKGLTIYPDNDCIPNYWTIPPEDRSQFDKYDWKTATPEERNFYNEFYTKHTIYCRDIDRTDKDLVSVVESLGESADGRHADLRVVEIPDGIDWEITEYDGIEKVEEIHRSWG